MSFQMVVVVYHSKALSTVSFHGNYGSILYHFRGGDWAGSQSAHAGPSSLCPPINGQCTNHRIDGLLLCVINTSLKG